MSGLEKILEHIMQDAKTEADGIIAAAAENADKIKNNAKEDADNMAAAIMKQSELDVAAAAKRIQSAAELQEKRLILKAKQEKIEEVFERAIKQLTGLEDNEYFAVTEKMIKRYSCGRGELIFNERDLKRLPAGITEAAKEQGLTISGKPADIIGGFIISYGDIEENCSFDALLRQSREALQDKIGRMLF